MRFTQHDGAALPMLLATRVLNSVCSSYPHVRSSANFVGRSSRSLRMDRCTKHSSSAEADASVHVHTSSGSRKKRMNYNERSSHCIYITRQLSRQNCPATTARVQIRKYQFKIRNTIKINVPIRSINNLAKICSSAYTPSSLHYVHYNLPNADT